MRYFDALGNIRDLGKNCCVAVPAGPEMRFTSAKRVSRTSRTACDASRRVSASGESRRGNIARAMRSRLSPKNAICSISLPMRL